MKLTHAENSMPKVAHAYSIPTCMYSWIKFLNNCYNNKTEVQKPEQGNAYEGECHSFTVPQPKYTLIPAKYLNNLPNR